MRNDVLKIFKTGIAAVDPVSCVKQHCRLEDQILRINGHEFNITLYRRIIIMGAGKASAFMAKAIEDILGDLVTSGRIITKYGHGLSLKRIEVSEAGHPIPDENGLEAAKAMLDLARSADRETLVICLLSGGGSALMPCPADGITLSDKQETTDILIRCGASIDEINIIRKHLSGIKGGRLAKAVFPATLVCLVISDVIGNDLSTIASGPAVPDPSTALDCLDIISSYGIASQLPSTVIRHLKRSTEVNRTETPKPSDPVFKGISHKIVADNTAALDAAKKTAQKLGYHCRIHTAALDGDTGKAARLHTDMAKKLLTTESSGTTQKPCCVLSGGETTNTVTGKGKGGRNMEFALHCINDIAGLERTVILSCGTDGTDGPTDAAGAIVDHKSLSKAKGLNLDPALYIKDNDSYHFFKKTGELVKTGPTHTNVMDLKIILCR